MIAAAAAILAAAAAAISGPDGAPAGSRVDAMRSAEGGAFSGARPTAITDLTRPYVTGAFTKRRVEERFLRSKADDAGHVSYLIGALKVAPPTTPGSPSSAAPTCASACSDRPI